MREVYPVLTDIAVASKSITSLGKLRPHSSIRSYTLPIHAHRTTPRCRVTLSALLSLVGPGHCFYHLLLGKTERRLPAFECDVF